MVASGGGGKGRAREGVKEERVCEGRDGGGGKDRSGTRDGGTSDGGICQWLRHRRHRPRRRQHRLSGGEGAGGHSSGEHGGGGLDGGGKARVAARAAERARAATEAASAVVARAAAKAAAREVVSEGANVVVGGSVGDLEPRRHRRIATRRTCRRGRRLPPRRAPDPTHIGGSRHDEGAAQQPAAADLVDLAGTHLCGPALDSTPVRRPTAAVSCGRGSRCGEEADRSSAAAEHAHQHAALSRAARKGVPSHMHVSFEYMREENSPTIRTVHNFIRDAESQMQSRLASACSSYQCFQTWKGLIKAWWT